MTRVPTMEAENKEIPNGTANEKDEERDNPYCLPPRMLNNGLVAYGVRVHNLPLKIDPISHVKNVRNMELRDDDVFIVAYAKSGTHWVWEILSMLEKQSAKHQERTKEYTMLDFNETSVFDAEPSPRLFNTHLYMPQLPKQIVTKKIKIVHVIRNPKDVLVSFYHHLKQGADEGFTFDNWLKAYMINKQFSMPHQFDFLRNISQFQREHPDHPIMHIYYEDLKRNPTRIIKNLADFLGVSASDSFCQEVATSCHFDQMKKVDDAREMPQHLREVFKVRHSFYRKGMIGDWKNHFTVTQNQLFDDFIAAETKKGLDFHFTYE